MHAWSCQQVELVQLSIHRWHHSLPGQTNYGQVLTLKHECHQVCNTCRTLAAQDAKCVSDGFPAQSTCWENKYLIIFCTGCQEHARVPFMSALSSSYVCRRQLRHVCRMVLGHACLCSVMKIKIKTSPATVSEPFSAVGLLV